LQDNQIEKSKFLFGTTKLTIQEHFQKMAMTVSQICSTANPVKQKIAELTSSGSWHKHPFQHLT
jgi:hypothetical protein